MSLTLFSCTTVSSRLEGNIVAHQVTIRIIAIDLVPTISGIVTCFDGENYDIIVDD